MSKREEDLLTEAKERYKQACEGWDDIYTQAKDDLKFAYDIDEGQWPQTIRNDREKDGRPVITVNKLQKFVRKQRGDSLMNRPRCKVIPVDSVADHQMADLYNGIIRQIEYLSDANIAYDTAYMHAVSGSVGYFRIITKYSEDSNFEQDIFIKRILNPFSVHLDPLAEEFELEDARYGFIEELIPKKLYEKKYPKIDAAHFDSHSPLFGEWISGENIRVAEYFYKDFTQTKIVQLMNGEILELGGDITKKYITDNGGVIVRERVLEDHVVKWCKINGVEILEEAVWPGKHIPIIPVFGDEIVVDGKRYYLSLIRGAKGPQQMYNYWATAATETVALAPKAPFIIEHRQIAGFEREWDEGNRVNRMYLRYKAITGLQKPSREPQTQIPTAIINMMQNTAYDVEDHLGQYEAAKGEASNERSGKAILARATQSDKGTFTFVDNLQRAVVYCGRQLIDLIPKIYDTPRAMRIQGEDGSQGVVDVNQPTMNPDGTVGTVNDLTVGKYDLISTIGKSFSSKREEMVASMIEAAQYAPQLTNVIIPLIFKYSDWPGAEEIYGQVKSAADQAQAAQMAEMQQTQIKYTPPGAA